MPWTKVDYPNSMKNLPSKVRRKAIDIANALLEKATMEEGMVIATAISRAKDWAANRGIRTEYKGKKSPTDVKQHGEDRYVIPYHHDQWAVKEEGEKEIEKVFDSKEEATQFAGSEARKANAAVTIQRKTGAIERRISFNPHRRSKKSTRTNAKK
jgi:uncharacterized protein YdaT